MSLSCLRLLLVAPPKLFRCALVPSCLVLRVFAGTRFSCEAVKSEFRMKYSTDIQNARTPPQFSFEIEISE
ncbi:hypothetical protein ALC57_06816 [Trachymyrmex cornetzi]|uniref:Secreted protein n=1 Tax=Trachymyrmex cornetzi TaxID=471704 RepID=A0A195E7W3_9HYME|nr:hypothetical protein ALC57_06816 [Trachymyrmex cornetzi]